MFQLKAGSFKWWYALIGLIILFISLGVSSVMLLMGGGVATGGISGVIQFILMILLVLIVFRLLRRGKLVREDLGLKTSPVLRIVLLGILGAAVFMILSFVFKQISPEAKDTTADFVKMLGIGDNAQMDFFQILAIAIAAPVAEELLFRGVIFRSFFDGLQNGRRKGSPVVAFLVATVVSAGTFLLAHIGGGQEKTIVMFFILGFICCLVYAMTGSLYASVLVHSLNNSITLFMTLVGSGIQLVSSWMYGLLLLGPIFSVIILKLIEIGLPKNK